MTQPRAGTAGAAGGDCQAWDKASGYGRYVRLPLVRAWPPGTARGSADGGGDAPLFLPNKAISLRLCASKAAFCLTMVLTAVAMSASDLPSAQPPATSSV